MRHKLRTLQASLSENDDNIIATINHYRKVINTANSKLAQFDIPYFNHLKIVFYDHRKIIFETDIPEMVSKIRELQDSIISLLRQDLFFKGLCEIKTQFKLMPIEHTNTASTEKQTHILEIFSQQKDQIKNPKLKQHLEKIIARNKHDN